MSERAAEISQAVRMHIRMLYLGMMNNMAPVSQKTAARLIRIEIDQETQDRLIYEMGPLYPCLDQRDGPDTFYGVDMYRVVSLPAPGWRIINPFEVQ